MTEEEKARVDKIERGLRTIESRLSGVITAMEAHIPALNEVIAALEANGRPLFEDEITKLKRIRADIFG